MAQLGINLYPFVCWGIPLISGLILAVLIAKRQNWQRAYRVLLLVTAIALVLILFPFVLAPLFFLFS